MRANPYLDAVRQSLPRLLALFDVDRTSASHGFGDRFHWAWGLIDFGNATFQGAAHGLARLWCSGLWPYASEPKRFIERIDSMFTGVRRLTRRDGSLEEAFPNEGSFCVTALVAFDLLCARELLRDRVSDDMQQRWLDSIEPMIGYLCTADEAHAFISNHLATAAAALSRWDFAVGDPRARARAKMFIDRIVAHQSSEGWFDEYGGADPGYQSLCTYYLADVHALRPDWTLGEPLARSVRFLWHFAHPDGSFGGIYGNRCTRFYVPAGIEALAGEIAEAAALADHMAEAIGRQHVVGLASMDEPNLVPMFNAWCRAAELLDARPDAAAELLPLPSQRGEACRIRFDAAGLFIDAGPTHYTVIGTRKGGVVAHFHEGRLALNDTGIVVRNPAGRVGSSQSQSADHEVRLEDDILEIVSRIRPMPKRLPTPLQFLTLRLLCVSLFRVPQWREWVKKRLVRWLIADAAAWPGSNLRRIRLGPALAIEDRTSLPAGYERVDTPGAFVAIHMASQGYWQLQDEIGPR